MSGDTSGTAMVALTDEVDIRESLAVLPCVADEGSVAFLRAHGRVFFLLRGPPGSGKGTVMDALREYYPDARTYWSDRMFTSLMAPPRNRETVRESHRLCQEKIEAYMKENVPVIINKNTNVTVWEISPYLRLGAKYGYVTILIDINRKFLLKPQVLAVTNSKGLNAEYMNKRMSQWEDVLPMAVGWFPSARDAVLLTRRFDQLRQTLSKEADLTMNPLRSPEGFPFCLARLCWFGWEPSDRDYCRRQEVEQAYGMKSTIKVFGYAILEGLVLALVQLSDDQVALCGTCSNNDGEAPSHEDDIAASFARSVSLHSWKETRCTVALEDIVDGNRTVEDLPKADKLSYLPVPRVRFIILGSTNDPFAYSRSLGGLHNRLAEEFSVSEEGVIQCEQKINVGGVDVYSTETAWLVLDDRSVELDAVFTGFYQPYSTGPRPRPVGRGRLRRPWQPRSDKW